MVTEKKPRRERCPRRIALGSYIFVTGISVALSYLLFDAAVVFDLAVRPAVNAIVWALLIAWILGGLWILVYGCKEPCPEKFE
jgi:hypothetical protein